MVVSVAELSRLSDVQVEQLESFLFEFERVWNPKQIEQSIADLPSGGDGLRRMAVSELVKIDIERCWQLGTSRGVEDYLELLPELGTRETVAPDLIQTEAEVRAHLGDPLSPQELRRRFPARADELSAIVDAESPSNNGDKSAETHVTSISDSISDRPSTTTQSSDSKSLPETFGRYRIENQLGQGAMGAVYLAHDTQLNRRVALKTPTFDTSADAEMVERFYREARAAANLRHAGICPVFDVGEIDGTHYISMAYIEGKPLSDLINVDKPLPIRTVASLARKIALALDYAHRQGVIHRDLKPANIMIDREKQPLIMDFGLAREIGKQEQTRLTQDGTILGTPAYMSPEQVEGTLESGKQSDVYSLGVILYELLTGDVPFQGTIAAVIGQIMTQDAPPPSKVRDKVDPALDAICQKMMARNTEDRYAGMKETAEALAEYLRSRGPKANRRGQPASAHPEANASGSPASVTEDRDQTAFLATTPSDNAPKARQHRAGTFTRLLKPWITLPPRAKAIATSTLAGLLLLMMGVILFVQTDEGTVKIEILDPSLKVSVGEETITIDNNGKHLNLNVGKHKLFVEYEGLQVPFEDSFEIKKNKMVALRVTRVEGKVRVLREGQMLPKEKDIAAKGDTASATSTITPADGWEDLVSLIEPKSDVLSGDFELLDEGFRLERDGSNEFAQLRLPATPEGHYRLRLDVTPVLPSELRVILPVQMKGVALRLVNNEINLERIDKKGHANGHANVPADTQARVSGLNKRYQVVVEVRPFNDHVQIVVEKNGKEILNWTGAQDRISRPSSWPDKSCGLQTWGREQTVYDIHSCELQILDGEEKLPNARTELFNGKDLSGWTVQGTKDWKVENGEIVGRGESSKLVHQSGTLTDFDLHLECLLEPGANSGIFIHTGNNADHADGYEVQLGEFAKYGTGSIWDRVPFEEKSVEPSTWFPVDVQVRGNSITVKVNGQVTVDYTDPAMTFSKGHIALQGHAGGGRVRFRKIELRKMIATTAEPGESGNDYDSIATGKWIDVSAVDPPKQDGDKVNFKDGILELDGTDILFWQFTGRNMILRAKVKHRRAKSTGLYIRWNASPYVAWLNRFRSDGSAGCGMHTYIDGDRLAFRYKKTPLRLVKPTVDGDGFVEMALAAIDERITLYISGKKAFEVTDPHHTVGAPGVGAVTGGGFIKDVQVMPLDEQSMPGSNRDIAAAAWTLSSGGKVQLSNSGGPLLTKGDELPLGSWKLYAVNLADVPLQDDDLKLLQKLTALERLDLQNSKITDDGLKKLENLKTLTSLRLTGTLVTAAGVAALKKVLPDCEIQLDASLDPQETNSLPDAATTRSKNKKPPIAQKQRAQKLQQ